MTPLSLPDSALLYTVRTYLRDAEHTPAVVVEHLLWPDAIALACECRVKRDHDETIIRQRDGKICWARGMKQVTEPPPPAREPKV